MGINKYFTVFVIIAGLTFALLFLFGPYTTTFGYGITAVETLPPPAYRVLNFSQVESKLTPRVVENNPDIISKLLTIPSLKSTVFNSRNHSLVIVTSTTENVKESNNVRTTHHLKSRSSTNTIKLSSIKFTVSTFTTIAASLTTATNTKSPITSSTYLQITPATTYQRRNLKPPTKFRICCGYKGGVGNHMFLFASTFGIAAKKGMTMILEKKNTLTKIFEISDVEFVDDYSVCSKFQGRGEMLASGYDQKLLNFKNDTNVRLGGYLQSWKYFFDSVDELRKQFVFKKNIKDKVEGIINSILAKYKIKSRLDATLVGVHIRRGDMVNNKYGYNVASKEYLARAIKYFKSKNLTNVILIVCSNDLNWSKSNMPSGKTTEYITGNTAEVDLAILGSCNHSISTVGSFSWWSAWLANGETTYYKWPAKEGSGLRRQYSKTYLDYFYPGWIGL